VDDAAEFARLMAGLRAGDPAAVEAVARRYGPVLRAAVRRHLHPRLRDRLDSLDVVQDVWASFLGVPADRLSFENPAALLAYLKQVAYHRAVEVYRRRFETEKDAIVRETTGDPGRRAVAQTPTPSMCVAAGEEWERLVSQFPEAHRVILRRLREGHELEDIARMAGVSVSTVSRVVRRLKELSGA
jgi:RNA polymerase sigma-70 factor (ECF subfamily)